MLRKAIKPLGIPSFFLLCRGLVLLSLVCNLSPPGICSYSGNIKGIGWLLCLQYSPLLNVQHVG
nr:MAG TPA: hypothetical protein [Caudoviricetes sp.]